METKDWMQILVGVIILGTLAWLGTQVFDMKGTLTRVDERVVAIADEMPEIGRYAAWRELDAPIKGALLASRPFKSPNKEWKITIHILNPNCEETKRFVVSLNNQNDPKLACALIGSAFMHDKTSLSFDRMIYFSRKAGEKVKISGSIDTKASFLFRNRELEDLTSIVSHIAGEPEKLGCKMVSRNWRELTKEIDNKIQFLKVSTE